jgi:malonyl CoA-acyl carrier protein transacylase
MTYALLFPGQGAQRCGMLHQVEPDADVIATALADAGAEGNQ